VTTVLVIDDDPAIQRFVRRGLEAQGYAVLAATEGIEGLRLAVAKAPALALVDLSLPGLSGTAVLAALLADTRQRPVVVLNSAVQVPEQVRNLRPAALDFLPKPFAMADLLARIRHCLSGTGAEVTSGPALGEELVSGTLRLNLRTRELSSPTRHVELSQREFALMQHLMRRRGNVCTRSELLAEVWGYAFDPGSNVVDVTVARLRSKLTDLRIETVRNVGYALREA